MGITPQPAGVIGPTTYWRVAHNEEKLVLVYFMRSRGFSWLKNTNVSKTSPVLLIQGCYL